ncbi:hypothetical protein [Gordonia sihwensis]|uniref:hypothetical protein n=1 Tax=Gordonia sihwensis TaxID=173559 RepID=UPI003D951511
MMYIHVMEISKGQKMRTLLTAAFAAICAVLATLACAAAGLAAAAPVVADVNLADPAELGPGARWWTYEGDGSCSAGWIVNDGAREYMYSAGHCAPKGARAMLGHGRESLGKVVISQSDERTNSGSDPVYDVAAIELENDDATNLVPGFGEAKRLMSKDELLSARPDLCVVGQRTGLSCGSFEGIQDNGTNILLRVPVDHGDSGGAVFAVTSSGEVVAVGTMIGFLKEDRGMAIAQILDGSMDPSMRFGRL